MGTPHKHAALIKAWADGAEIEVLTDDIGPNGEQGNSWKLCVLPRWYPEEQYRVKPVPHRWQKEMDAAKAGKTIQYRRLPRADHEWIDWLPMLYADKNVSVWTQPDYEFRIKPERVVKQYRAQLSDSGNLSYTSYHGSMNLKLTFEDAKLVKAEVI